MPQIKDIIERMSQFMSEEPSGKFTVGGWHKALREYELKDMAEFSNKYDDSKELTLIYLANFCRELIEHTSCPVGDAIRGTKQLKKYKDCFALVNSKQVRDVKDALVEKMAAVVDMLSTQKTIGDSATIGKAVDIGIDALFNCFAKLGFEIYANSGKPVGSLGTTSLSVLSCMSLAECLLRLEKSPDGIYVCYISNPGTRDGWFGFFVRSNGNMFSYNERIDEAYIGQHGNMRNGRYTEGKAYDLFPYELCEASEETDYKGYAREIRLGKSLNLVDEKNLGLVVRMLLCLSVIARRHCGATIEGEPVIVNSLLPVNLALLAQNSESFSTTALVEWKSSPLVEYAAKLAVPTFEVSRVLNGDYNKEFNGLGRCWFLGLRQDIVDAYGSGFTIQNDKILASNSSLRLLGNGESEQEFIGTKSRLRVQAYYEVRKQLCNYIGRQMADEYKSFGGRDGLNSWYRENLNAVKDKILRYCLEAYSSIGPKKDDDCIGSVFINSNKDDVGQDSRFGNSKTPTKAAAVEVYLKVGLGFWRVMMLSAYEDRKYKCWLTGRTACFFFRFSFYSYHQVQEFLGCNLPRFCTGWYRFHRYSGNPILDIVDPVERMKTPLAETDVPFDFFVALSKRGIRKLKKDLLI